MNEREMSKLLTVLDCHLEGNWGVANCDRGRTLIIFSQDGRESVFQVVDDGLWQSEDGQLLDDWAAVASYVIEEYRCEMVQS